MPMLRRIKVVYGKNCVYTSINNVVPISRLKDACAASHIKLFINLQKKKIKFLSEKLNFLENDLLMCQYMFYNICTTTYYVQKLSLCVHIYSKVS